MQYWLMKSEPDVWSIDQQKKAGAKGAPWDGVRNYQAAKNLKSMKKGDLCFFYHSNIGKEIVGIVEVIKEAYLDKTDKSGRFVAVTVKFVEKLSKIFSCPPCQNVCDAIIFFLLNFVNFFFLNKLCLNLLSTALLYLLLNGWYIAETVCILKLISINPFSQ